VIDNVPFLCFADPTVSRTIRYWFPIGPEGIEVQTVNYGFTLTSTLAVQPPVTGSAQVIQDTVYYYPEFLGTSMKSLSQPNQAQPQQGGAVVEAYQYNNFPNQQAGVNECVPTAVSNSLQFLNTENNLGMAEGDISTGSLYTGVGCTADGSPNPGWVENKKNYVKEKNLPITTGYIMSGSHCINELGPKVMKDGQDVELVGDWTVGSKSGSHCMNVTGWADLGNGNYELITSDDQAQGDDSQATFPQSSTFNKNTGTWSGALSDYSGSGFYFVYECPTVPVTQTTTNLPGGETIETKPKAGPSYDGGKYKVDELKLSGFINSIPAPALDSTVMIVYSCQLTAEYSSDYGETFRQFTGYADVTESVTHTSSSEGIEYYNTQIMDMNLMCWSLDTAMTHIFIRRNTVHPSTGIMQIRPAGERFRIDSFFDVFTELSIDWGGTWMPQDHISTCMEIGQILPPETREIGGMVFGPGLTSCYDAQQTITVGGICCPVEVMPGGDLLLISGNHILLEPATRVMPGGHLLAMITTQNEYCSSQMYMAQQNQETVRPEDPVPGNSRGKLFFSVYPDPTTGDFTLRARGTEAKDELSVTIYGMFGNKILETTICGKDKYEFSLTGQHPGVYILRVTSGNETGTVKIIKR